MDGHSLSGTVHRDTALNPVAGYASSHHTHTHILDKALHTKKVHGNLKPGYIEALHRITSRMCLVGFFRTIRSQLA